MIRPATTALAVAAGVAVLVGGAALVGPPESVVEEHPGVREPVVSSTLVCPYVGGESAGKAEVGVLALPGVAAPEGEGEPAPVTVTALAAVPAPDPDATAEPEPTTPPEPEPVLTVPGRGAPVISEIETSDGTSFAVEGDGPLAPGLAAEQSLLVQSTDLRGLSTAPCTPATREQWFVGGSGVVGNRGRLVLANPTDVPAVVDIELWDEAGPIEAAGTQDLGVPARSQRILLLDALAPESARVAARVTTSQGRVTAALEDRESAEITPQGMTFIPAAVPPTTHVVVPGVPGHGQRLLRIVAPGETDAIVSMRLLGPNGPFSPVDQDVLTVTAGSVAEVPLDAAGSDPVAVSLESDEPITAAVRVVDTPSDDGLPDVAYSAAAEPLSGPATALLGRGSGGFTTTIMLSSVTDVGARATVTTLGADGVAATETPVDIPAGSTVPVVLELPDGVSYVSAIVEPAAPGTVVAAREIVASDSDGALLDLMPLISPAVEVQVPEVVGELPAVPDPDETE